MPDYNLGRATGEIQIEYDGRGMRQAQADMAGTATEAAALDAAMGRVNRQFDENRKVVIASAEDIVRARGELDELGKAYRRADQERARADRAKQAAIEELRDVVRDHSDDLDKLREANNKVSKAEEELQRARLISIESLEKFRVHQAALNDEVARFNRAHVEASRGFQNLSRDAEKFGEALESITEKLSAVARILGQAGLFGLFGGAAAGQLFATGASALNLLATAMGAVVQIAESFAGAIALIPAAVNAAVLSIGPLIVGLHGIGQALGSIGDPAKFIEAIRDLSPAAQQAMLTIQSFTYAFRGARDQIQDSLFAPIIADIQPLITTWLPQLMRAGQQIASEWGTAFHQVFSFFQTPAAQQGFQTFVSNLVTGFQAARGAIQPFLEAWNTLATVGSGVFERLGNAITIVANEFNAWIQRTAQSGELLNFINTALDNFTLMGHIIRDVGIAIHNIFQVFHSDGQSSLQTIADISAEFRSWTQSISGQQSIANFFNLIQVAANAVRPQIHLLGEAISVIAGTLTRLGVAIQPGLNSFLSSFVEALRNLSPYIIQLAPAINEFLAAFGQTLLQVVNTLGPRLPQFFKDMSDAFIQLMQLLPPVVDLLAQLLDHMTPQHVEILLGLVGALKLLGLTLPAVRGAIIALNLAMDTGPIGLTIVAIGGLVAAGVLLYKNWDTVKEKINELTSRFGGMTGILDTVKRKWNELTTAVRNFFTTLGGQISGGWEVVMNAVSGLGDKISNAFSGILDQAFTWGQNLIHQFGDGILAAADWIQNPIEQVMQIIRDHIPHSPAKRGPLSDASPEDLGSRLVTQYAAGMIAGRPAVDSAASSVAGSASGIGGAGFGSTQFTSAGISGTSGKDFTQGQSGFDQWVSFLTKDLSAWNNIFREGWDLFSNIAGVVTDTIKVVASIWGGGNNPLTQPGGIAGPPGTPQQSVFGVPMKPIPGRAPIPELAPLGGPRTQDQQSVPGVPSKAPVATGPTAGPVIPTPAAPPPPAGLPNVEGNAGTGGFSVSGVPPANPPASTTGGAGPQAPAPGDDALTAALKANGSFTPGQIRLIQGFNKAEGPNPAGNPTLGFRDDQLGGDSSLQGHVNALADQFRRRQGAQGPRGIIGPFPENGSDREQAEWIADVVGQNSSPSDIFGAQQPPREHYVQSVISGLPPRGTPAQTTGAAAPAGGPINARALPPGMAPSEGLHPNADLLNRAVTAVFGDRIRAVGGSIGGNRSDDSGSGEHHGGALDIVLGPLGQQPTPEALALGNEIQDFIQQNKEAFGTQWTIWQGRFNPAGGPGRAYGEHGGITANHYDHIHAFTGDEEGNVPSGNTPENQGTGIFRLPPGYTGPLGQPITTSGMPPVAGLPRGPGGITRGGLRLPSDAATYAIGGLGALGGAALLARSLRGLRDANGNLLEIRYQQELLRTGSPSAALDAIAGVDPETRGISGINVDASGQPVRVPSTIAQEIFGPPDNLGNAIPGPSGARGAQSLRNLLRSRQITPGQAAAIDPNLLVDVYHATDDAGARGILNEGFRANPQAPNRLAYFADDLRNARLNANIYGPNVLHARVPITAFDPDFPGGLRAPVGNLQGVNFRQLTPEELGVTDLINRPPTGATAALGDTARYNPFATDTGIPTANPPASTTGSAPATTTGDVGRAATNPWEWRNQGPRWTSPPPPENPPAAVTGQAPPSGQGVLGRAARGLGTAADVVGIPLMIGQTGDVVAGRRAGPLTGAAAVTAPTVIGGGALAAGSAAGVALLPAVAGAGALLGVATATGAATGQESSRTPGVIYGPRGEVLSAGPRAPSIFGGPGAQAERRGSSPVHVTNPEQLPGGTRSSTPPVQQIPVRPTAGERPPRPGEPGFIGPVAPNQRPGADQGPRPGAQAERRGADEAHLGETASRGLGPAAPDQGQQRQVPKDTRSPLSKFTDTMGSIGTIAGDAFTVFQDFIESIGAAANITDTLVRGFANTEDVVHFIQQFQTFIKTAADVAKLVGDVGGLVGQAGGGDPTGMTGAVGGAIQAIAGIVSSALEATNAAISLGIDIYHEVGKYAGFIFGDFLGGAATGPLGGNVRMLLNTRTNQLQTYSEDNPLNKNTFDIPLWQRSYQQQQTPPSLPPQVNIYAGPGQTPQAMMAESMWLATTGGPAVASVAGVD